MKKVLLALLLVCMVLPIAVRADSPVDVEGDFVYVPVPVKTWWVGDTEYIYATDTATWTGDFEGTSAEKYMAVLEGSQGNFVYEKGHYVGRVTFTGTVVGREGTLQILFRGTSPGNIADWTGTWRIIRGTGELAGVHGQGVFWSNAMADIHYEGHVYFDAFGGWGFW
jgi:hypothetical protein